MNYTQTKPCVQCPFRSDVPAYLRKARVREIDRALVRGTFPCHKTLDYRESEGRETPKTQHCAGALILLEKLERPSQMMRTAERLGLYDARALNMDAPVFDSFEDMEDAQEETRTRSKARS